MQLQIESPHLVLSDRLTELVQRKFAGLGKKYQRMHSCDITLQVEPGAIGKRLSVKAKIEYIKSRLFASAYADSFEAALDHVIRSLEHQLRRVKEEREEIW